MNRGSGAGGRDTPRAWPRFNEAPIHESGKFRLAAAPEGWRRGASMRPRFMNRGSAPSPVTPGTGATPLQ